MAEAALSICGRGGRMEGKRNASGAAKRANNFKEVRLALTEEMAVREAKRCARCDLELLREVSSDKIDNQ